MVQENIVILLKVFYCINGENFTFSLVLMKGGLKKVIAAAGLVGRVGMPSLSFQLTIPDSIKVSYPSSNQLRIYLMKIN